VALELISRPSILILDEPSSGLDSFAAEKVLETLKDLTKLDNIAVLLVIHQPSSRIFHLLDKIIFVKEGKIAFQGPPSEIKHFFTLQKEKEWHDYNPADQAMELLCRDTCVF
jgi:ABC-type multidrug transport system ATPase subunit